MKRFLFVICFGILANMASYAQSKDQLEVNKILRDDVDAWNSGDLQKFMLAYWHSDSLVFIGKSDISYGWNEALKNYMERYPDTTAMGKLAFNIIDIKQLSREYIFVTGKWHLVRTIGDLSGHFTLLFQKINGAWLIITDHSS